MTLGIVDPCVIFAVRSFSFKGVRGYCYPHDKLVKYVVSKTLLQALSVMEGVIIKPTYRATYVRFFIYTCLRPRRDSAGKIKSLKRW